MDAHTGEQFNMEAEPEGKNILQIGRFSFGTLLKIFVIVRED
jgi:hypothetical protein